MSFAQEYLDLMTECQRKICNLKNEYGPVVKFFGVEAAYSDESASQIIQHTVEEYESTVRVIYNEGHADEVEFYFSSSEDCLFNSYVFKDTSNLDMETFLIEYFEYELKEIKDDREKLETIFKSFSSSQLDYFVTCYTTALEAYFIDLYHEKYKELKAQYPDLPFYPNYDFGYSLEDYYESSTCW